MNPENQTPSPTPQNEPSVPISPLNRPGTVFAPGTPSDPPPDQPSGPPLTSPSPPSRLRQIFSSKLALLVAGFLVLLGAAASASYFMYYRPNQPDNIWRTALTNTGKGYDKLSDYLAKPKDTKGIDLKGSFKLSGSVAADGNFAGQSSDDNSRITGSLSASGVKVSLDLRAIKATGSTPDIYFKVDGLQGLGNLLGGDDPQTKSAYESLNNNWYFIDHTFFDQFAKGANTDLQITSNDINSILKAAGNANKKYIFTNDSQKMAVVVKQKIGKETQDGRNVYHYKIGFDKQNLKAYVDLLCVELKTSKLNKFFGSEQAVDQAIDCKGLDEDIKKMDDSRTADAWVDLRTKLLHKIRFSQKAKPDNYIDIGQNYSGGNSFPFTVDFHSQEGDSTIDGNFQLTIDTASDTYTLKGNTQTGGSDSSAFKFDLTVSPSRSTVKVDKPAGARSFIQLLNDLGFGELFSGDISSSASGPDTERQTDINALHSQIEAYYAQNAVYPTLANINDPAWRNANMRGLDAEALKDPEGTSRTLVNAPRAKVYSYQASPAGCDNESGADCTSYTLTATLADGTTYAKQSLD